MIELQPGLVRQHLGAIAADTGALIPFDARQNLPADRADLRFTPELAAEAAIALNDIWSHHIRLGSFERKHPPIDALSPPREELSRVMEEAAIIGAAQRLQATALLAFGSFDNDIHVRMQAARLETGARVFTLTRKVAFIGDKFDGEITLQFGQTVLLPNKQNWNNRYVATILAERDPIQERLIHERIGQEIMTRDLRIAAAFKVYDSNGGAIARRVVILTAQDGGTLPGLYKVLDSQDGKRTVDVEAMSQEGAFIGANEYALNGLGTLKIDGEGRVSFATNPADPHLLVYLQPGWD